MSTAIAHPTGQDSLRAYLVSHGIDVDRFGTGDAKTLEHLWREVSRGECQLVQREGRLVRVVYGVAITIRARRNGQTLILREDRQEFRDGRVVRRGLRGSLGEKGLPGESPSRIARRALAEELGIDWVDSLTIPAPIHRETTEISRAYPGLLSNYLTAVFEIDFGPGLADWSGYVEEQLDKVTHFVWEPDTGERGAEMETISD